jgi:post-segregation antitoxin (ccd killing protein)
VEVRSADSRAALDVTVSKRWIRTTRRDRKLNVSALVDRWTATRDRVG